MSNRERHRKIPATRPIKRDRSKRPVPADLPGFVKQDLEDLVLPIVLAKQIRFHEMGLRNRILNLPVVTAFVLSLIWRQLGSVADAVRLLNKKGFLWTDPLNVTEKGATERLRTLPDILFKEVLDEVLPLMHERARNRPKRLTPALKHVLSKFDQVVAVDASTLDSLMRNTGLLRQEHKTPLAGRMFTVIDLSTQLPIDIVYDEKYVASDQDFWPYMQQKLKPGSLNIFDKGFVNYTEYASLSEKGISFITRPKNNTSYTVEKVHRADEEVTDEEIRMGEKGLPLRLIKIKHNDKWYSYLTNVLDPQILPAEYVGAMYALRWRIEDAFNMVKRLLGLAYFLTSSPNGVKLQVWATWLLYSLLIDLTDRVAERLGKPLSDISIEMTYRSLFFYVEALKDGEKKDFLEYIVQDAQLFGIIKAKRKDRPLSIGQKLAKKWVLTSGHNP